MAVPRCGRSPPPATTSSSSSPAPTGGAGGAARLSPSPVKAAAAELGLPVTHDIDDLLDGRRRPRRRRRLRADHQAARPRRRSRWSTCTSRCCRDGAARRRSSGRCWPATTSPACASWASRKASTPAPVYARREVPIGPATTAGELRAELVDVGTELLVDALAAPLPEPVPQAGDVTYADEDRRPTSCASPGSGRPPSSTGWVRVGGAWTTFRGRRLKVHDVAVVPDTTADQAPRRRRRRRVGTGDGALRLLTVQPEGKPPMRWSDFANGARPAPGERLGPDTECWRAPECGSADSTRHSGAPTLGPERPVARRR